MPSLEPLIDELRFSLLEAEGDGGMPVGSKSKRKSGIWQKMKHGVWKKLKGSGSGGSSGSSPSTKGKPPPKPPMQGSPKKKSSAQNPWPQDPNYQQPKEKQIPKIGELAPVLPGKKWKSYKHEPRSTEEKYRKGGHWTPERKELHRAIFKHFLSTTQPVPRDKKPVAIMMMGGPATGKGQLTNGISPKKFVKVDADNIKEMIPEYQEMVKKGDKDAASYVHAESGALASRLRDLARKQRKNMVLDGTGRYLSSYMHRMGELQDAGYHVQLLMPVVSDVDTAVARAKKRGEETGRHVPEKFIRDNHAEVMKNFVPLSKMADSAFLFDNDGNKPKIAWAKQGAVEHNINPDFADAFFSKYGKRKRSGRSHEEIHHLARDVSALVTEAKKDLKPDEDPMRLAQDLVAKAEPEKTKDARFGDNEGLILPEPDDAAI